MQERDATILVIIWISDKSLQLYSLVMKCGVCNLSLGRIQKLHVPLLFGCVVNNI